MNEVTKPKPKTAPVIIGSLFGDEGKGRFTDDLAREGDYVIRYSGGHQAGHTVQLADGRRFVFSSLSSGTLRNATTIIAPGVVWDPCHMLEEIKRYRTMFPELPKPRVFVHEDACMSSPYDAIASSMMESRSRRYMNDPLSGNGSCGFGIWATVFRNTRYDSGGNSVSPLTFPSQQFLTDERRVEDFLVESRHSMLDFIRKSLESGPRNIHYADGEKWRVMQRGAFSRVEMSEVEKMFHRLATTDSFTYCHGDGRLTSRNGLLGFAPDEFSSSIWSALQQLREHYFVHVDDVDRVAQGRRGIIFEGSQGLALDPGLMLYPHTTATPVGLRQAIVQGRQFFHNLNELEIQPIYAVRTYRTRHGAGPLNVLPHVNPSGREHHDFAFTDDVLQNISGAKSWPADKTNVENPHQGELRTAPLDLGQLAAFIHEDVLRADIGTKSEFKKLRPVLAVSHMDVFAGGAKIPVVIGDTLQSINEATFLKELEAITRYEVKYTSSSPARKEQ